MVQAEHLVGGDMTYVCNGNDNYSITLNVYRDCFSSGAPFDPNPPIGIYTGTGVFVGVQYFSFPIIQNLSTIISNDCFMVNTSVCVERGTYSGVINLPPNNTGYYLVYERCCRNGTIVNLSAPDTQGSTYTAFIPPQSLADCNNSPVWNSFPPIGVCLDIPMEFDQSATDPDGDDLVYELCRPYTGGSQFNPAPDPPSGPTFQLVTYGGGYNADFPIDATPELSIDPATGMISGTPTQIGQYVIGLCVKEYRNGILLSETRRDFQFNVTTCPNLNVAAIASQAFNTECNGLAVDFENMSVNASSYLWIFGDGNSSTDFEPSYVYSDPGTYEVMLISDPGQICADTTIQVFSLFEPVNLILNNPQLECSPDPVYDIDLFTTAGAIESAIWDFGGGVGDNSAISPQNVSFAPGSYNLQVDVIDENGCEASAEIPISVPPEPVALIANNNVPCSGYDITFINESENATNFQWDFGLLGTNDQSNENSPIFTYPSAGSYTAELIVSAAGSCPDTVYHTVSVTPAIYADFEIPGGQCFNGNSFDFNAQGTYTSNATLTWTFQNASISTFIGPNPPNVNFQQFGQNMVSLNAFEEGCETNFDGMINVVPNPEADLTYVGDGCEPMAAYFQNLSFGGSQPSYSWNFGDGTSSVGQSPTHVYTNEGLYSVSLWVVSDGDCVDSSYVHYPDLIKVNPSPHAGFYLDAHEVDILDPSVNGTTEFTDPNWGCEFYISDSTFYPGCDFYHEFPSPGTYSIMLIVTNEFGCSDRAVQEVLVTGSLFWAPNALTMDGDGLNDFFHPVVLGAAEYEIEIYDRWGQLMFRSSDPNEAWIPLYAHPGIYVYKALVQEEGSLVHEYLGHFTIIR